MDVKRVLELHELAVESAGDYPVARPILATLQSREGRHFTGILGPRGVGKTVLLKQCAARQSGSVYVSLDTLPDEADLFDLVLRLHKDYGVGHFYLDEVHFRSDIESALKALYDALAVRIWFTSSVALALHESAYDLSRRVRMQWLYPFSFREYLHFRHGIQLDTLSMQAVFDRAWSSAHMRAGIYFDAYLQGGLMPFALEEPEPLPLLKATVETVIRRDIPRVARLHTDELDTLDKLLAFIGRSPVDGVNYSSLSKNLGITKYKSEQYLALLEKAFIVQRVFPKGTNVLKEPKVLLAPPYRLLYRNYEDAVGGLREDYFAEAMRYRGVSFSYLKTMRGRKTPDFAVEIPSSTADDALARVVIEIGGKGKGIVQFKDYQADRRFVFSHSDACDGLRRPLFMLGMA